MCNLSYTQVLTVKMYYVGICCTMILKRVEESALLQDATHVNLVL